MKHLFCLSLVLLLTACSESAVDSEAVALELGVEPLQAEALAESSTEVDVPETPSVAIPGADSPFSFASFLEQDFSGTAFTVGNLIADRGSHNSYYATYKSHDLKISATWHVPKGEGPFPVLILNHGYFPPEEYTNGYGFGREQKYFAQAGYAVLHIDYRGYGFSDAGTEQERLWGDTGFATDAVNAALALKNANLDFIDTNRMGLFGHSLGGGVTLNAALARPDLFKVAVMWGPVSSDYFDNFNRWRRNDLTEENQEAFEAEFGSLDERDSFMALSAYPYLDRLEAPLLLQHGTADESCDIAWSQFTFKVLQGLGKNVEYIEYNDVGHVFWNDDWALAVKDADEFIAPYLKLEEI